jgi:hypothetical protein
MLASARGVASGIAIMTFLSQLPLGTAAEGSKVVELRPGFGAGSHQGGFGEEGGTAPPSQAHVVRGKISGDAPLAVWKYGRFGVHAQIRGADEHELTAIIDAARNSRVHLSLKAPGSLRRIFGRAQRGDAILHAQPTASFEPGRTNQLKAFVAAVPVLDHAGGAFDRFRGRVPTPVIRQNVLPK